MSSLGRFDSANLQLRIISSVILAPLALICIYFGGIFFAGLITAATAIGFYEWLRMVAPQAHARTIGWGGLMLIILMAAGFLISPALGAMLGVVSTLALFLIAVRDVQDRAHWVALGIPYMGGSGLALLSLRDIPVNGAGLSIYLVLVVWATDIGAYAFGRTIGGPKLAPSISPKKTWAGLAGGMISATAVGFFVAWALLANVPWMALVISPALALVAQMGDLFESFFKRRAGVKESGDLIPGHGGVLDRIDGLVFAAVVLFLFQASVGAMINWW